MEDKKKENSFFENIKKTDMKKKSRIVIIFFFVFALVFATITNLGFKSFNFLDWLADMLILLGIEVFGLIFGELIGLDRYHEDLESPYQRNLGTYNKQMNENREIILKGFSQWYSEKIPIELFNKKRDYLTSVGIEYVNAVNIIRYLDVNEINKLTQEDVFKVDENKNKIFIAKIKPYQETAVKQVLEGELKLDAPNASYYLSASNDNHSNLSFFELGNAYQKDIKQTRTITRIVKLASSVIISAFMAALTVYELMGGDSLNAWMKLISRITALITSLFSGVLSAKTMVSIEAKAIKNKVYAIGMFIADVKGKYFTIKSDKEIIEEKWKKHEKEEQEAIKKVVDPEVLEESDIKKVVSQDIEPKALENKSNRITLKQ